MKGISEEEAMKDKEAKRRWIQGLMPSDSKHPPVSILPPPTQEEQIALLMKECSEDALLGGGVKCGSEEVQLASICGERRRARRTMTLML